MRNKLFTAAVNKQLANQYKYGSDLSKQKVVTKIFNPYGEGRWYLLNSDPNDPDYIWAIVTMYGNVEIGSVSRRELESLRLTPFRLPLERDIYFDPINAEEVFNGLVEDKFYADGGRTNVSKNKTWKQEWTNTKGENGYDILEIIDTDFFSNRYSGGKVVRSKIIESSKPERVGKFEENSKIEMRKIFAGKYPFAYPYDEEIMMAKGGEVEKDWYDIRSYSIAEHGEDGAKKMAEKYIDEHIKYWKGQVTAGELKIRKSPFGGQDFKGEYVVMRLFPKFAKGGIVEYIYKGNDRNNLYYKRFNGAIGSFAWRHEKRYNEGIIYPLDDFDMEYYSHLKLKPNEVILRYRTDRMIRDVKYLVKFNLEKSLVYFMDSDRMSDDDDKNIIFQGRGIPMEYMVLDWDKLYPSQQMNVNYAKGGKINDNSYPSRFNKFIKELERLSNDTGIAISDAGCIYDNLDTFVSYSNDWTSGDIIPNESKTRYSEDAPKNWYKFIDELEDISNKNGVAVQIVGGVSYNQNNVVYDKDWSSNDLQFTSDNVYAEGGDVSSQKIYEVEYEIGGKKHISEYMLYENDRVEKMLPPTAKIISIKEKFAKGGEMAEGGLVKGLSVDEFAYLYIKRALISAYRESYLRPIGLWNTAKAKEVERSLTSKGLLNSGGAITTKGKELAKEIDTELEKVFSGGYIGSMTENRVSKYESVKAKFNN